MNLYLALKFLHVLGAAILFGTGLGIAFFQFRANRKESPAAIAAILRTVVVADYLFTATAALLQPITGFALVQLRGYELSQTWIALSLALYVLIGLCWLPVVALQIRMRDVAEAAVVAGEACAAAALSGAGARMVLARLAGLSLDAGDFLVNDRQAHLTLQTNASPGITCGPKRSARQTQ